MIEEMTLLKTKILNLNFNPLNIRNMKYKKLKIDYKTSIKKQLEKLGIKTYIDLDKIQDLFPHPKDGYIYDVEDGKEMLGKSPEQAEKEFKKEDRRGLNVYEVLAIIRKDPKVLKDHYIDCTGSRYGSADRVPNVFLGNGDRPWLNWNYVFSFDHWGSASCGSRDLEVGNLGLLENRILDLEKFKESVEKILKL